MRYLLDTHVCLWAIGEKDKLSPTVRRILTEDSSAQLFVSQISFFEIAIKLKTGKLVELNAPLSVFIESVYDSGAGVLPLKDEHLQVYSQMVFNDQHRDPFDRYLISTAISENMAIITKDKMFDFYSDKLNIVW